jgi:hypothetical protein
MEAMRQSWTDERLDDFRGETARRFDAVDKRFDAVDKRFETVDRRFDAVEQKMDAGFERLDCRIDALQRTLLQLGGGIIVALLGLIATQL